MIQILRKNQRGLMLLVAFITIVAFVFLYNTTQLDELASVRDPSIYGKALNPAAIERQVKNYHLTSALGQFDLLEKLGGTAPDQGMAITQFVWNLLVLQHQSRELGIEPTDDQIADRIKEIPIFQTKGQFDPTKYSSFVSEQLTPRGFTERQLEEVVRDSLRLESISEIVEAPAAIGQAEIDSVARIFQPVTATYVKFNNDQAGAQVTLTEEEIAAFHKANQNALVTDETRTVRCAVFELPAEPKLEGKAKIEALQKLANAASALTSKISDAAGSFEAAAKEAGVEIKKLAAFDRTGVSKPGETQPVPAEALKTIAPATFLLSKAGQTSDILQSGDAFYIVELLETTPARPLTLEESRSQIETALRAQKAAQLFAASSNSAYNSLSAALASGKSLKDAAAAQKLETVELLAIVPAAESTSRIDQNLAAATLLLKDGELSKLEQAPWGAFAIQLQSRGPVDEKLFSKQGAELRETMIQGKRELLFAEWLRVSRDAARIIVPSNQG
ncbi:MAG: SurA N-terminal domain-containing protein [Terrimicrobiaceae bacterium]